MITLPSPPPQPGPPASEYENDFNIAYYQSRRPELQPFFYGRPGSKPGTELTESQREELANDLYARKIDFDEQIDFQGMNPYGTMHQRLIIYGYTRVKVGTGTTVQPIEDVSKEDLHGPAIPGQYLKVSIDIKDYPLFA